MYLYPPLFAILISPLHFLPPQWQGMVWYFLSLAMVWRCCREAARLLHHAKMEEWIGGGDSAKTLRRIQIAAGIAVLIPTLDCLQRGQVGILILYLMLLGLRLVTEGDSWKRTVVGGMVLALSIVFKIIPALPVFFLLFLLMIQRIQKTENAVNPFRFLRAGAGVLSGLFLFFFVVPSMFIGWQSNVTYLNKWSSVIGTQAVETGIEAHFSNPRGPKNQSLSNALYHTGNQIAFDLSNRSEPNPWLYNKTEGRFMSSPAVTQVVLVIRVLLGLLLIPLAWRRSGSPLDRLAAFGLACTAMLIVSPVARGHYFMLELPAVLFVSLWMWRYKGSSWAVLCASIPAALSVMHYVFITFPQMFGPLKSGPLLLGTLGIGTTLWYLVMAYILIISSAAKASIDTETEPSGQGSSSI